MDTAHPAAFGVAGNMTGHLEQAGEAGDFVAVRAAAGRPKGMFPICLPGLDHRLGIWPFSSRWLALPGEPAQVQPEPELALRCTLAYDEGGVCSIVPDAFAAADDTSLRRHAPKIHHKKNWGPHAKGLAADWLPLDRFDAEGVLHHHRLGCWLVRDGRCQPYGEDSPIRTYGTCYGELLAWMTDRLRNQADEGPLDDMGAWLQRAGRPTQAVICIGATRYTPLGQQTYVQPGDEVIVAVYDERSHDPGGVGERLGRGEPLQGASVLRREVVTTVPGGTSSAS